MNTAIQLLLAILAQAGALSQLATRLAELIRTAREQGREITEAELDGLAAVDDIARQALVDAIAAARAANP